MPKLNFTKLIREVGKWAGRNFPKATYREPLLGVIEEQGELAHAHLKIAQGIRGKREEHEAARKDAVGDLVIFLAHYCHLNEEKVGEWRSGRPYHAAGDDGFYELFNLAWAVGEVSAGSNSAVVILRHLYQYCRTVGIDMDSAVLSTWAEVRKRDWIKYPKNGRTE